MSERLEQTHRRRTFAIISHPDAGKTTLTEKLLLFGGANESFLKTLETELGKEVPRGVFGADMQVSLINDGPVTICMDTQSRE